MIESMQLPHHPASDMDNETLTDAIHFLKGQKNAVILAHYYQYPEIQDLADFVGDSLALARQAATTDADRIVFCGVHFMAETAKILNPEKKVLLPDPNAGCSLADSCPPESFSQFLQENPGHTVVSYVNCTAEVKAMSDLICTSSNAVDIINNIPESQPIIFAPDANLGRYLRQVTGRDMKLWEGACLVHEAFAFDKLITLMRKEPEAELIAHPEAESDILRMADFIGSTGKLLKYVKESRHDKFIIATEVGIIHQMQQDVPHKKLIPAPIYEDNTCACSECAFMKMNTLEKLHRCLVHDSPEIDMDSTLMKEAKKPLERMLEYSK